MAEPQGTRGRRPPARSRIRVAAIAAAGALGLLGGAAVREPLLVWNASASSPRGLYAIVPGPPRVGDFVVARAPASAAVLAGARGYLPAGVPLVKTLAARSGDRVCARRERIWINDRPVAVRLRLDRAGRPLPWWSGCRTLGAGQVLLLGSAGPASFDGRYFGPVEAHRLLGRARLLWRA